MLAAKMGAGRMVQICNKGFRAVYMGVDVHFPWQAFCYKRYRD